MELNEKCAVFGIYGRDIDVARLTFFGLYSLQHRGQESSGIAVSDGSELYCYKNNGLVAHVYDEVHIRALKGHISVGHNRYSTSAGSGLHHAQPILTAGNKVAVAHNGNLPSVVALLAFLKSVERNTEGKSDSALIADAVGYYVEQGMALAEAVEKVFPLMTGAFSLLFMDAQTLVAVRDGFGIRPLCLGQIGEAHVVSSETCALDAIGATYVNDVAPGELVAINASGLTRKQLVAPDQKMDIFEYIYFARPDSMLLGQSVYEVRCRFGKQLAAEYPVDADIVVPVPETANPMAIGYARESGLPFEMGLIKNRYVHRTFIEPDQHIRDLGVKMKLNPLPSVLKGRRVIVVDDSIVRGTTSRQIVRMLFSAGATEVHFLVSSPPVRFPDFYGIDLASQSQMLAFRKSVEDMRVFLGATSLGFLSYEGMIAATGVPESSLCTSVFTGHYPLPIHEREADVSHTVLPDADASRVIV